jgi:hypothetical protein
MPEMTRTERFLASLATLAGQGCQSLRINGRLVQDVIALRAEVWSPREVRVTSGSLNFTEGHPCASGGADEPGFLAELGVLDANGPGERREGHGPDICADVFEE